MVILAAIIWFDGDLSKALTGRHSPAVRLTAEWGYWMGHGMVQVLGLLVLTAVAWIAKYPALRKAALSGLAAFCLSGFLSQFFKHIIGRPRPRIWAEGMSNLGPTFADGFNSFPSGHTSTSVAIATVLSFYYPKAAPLFMAVAAFISAARIVGGSHFPLDVVGGIALGLFVGWGVYFFSNCITRRKSDTGEKP
jgi:membrane-associated phospholipid phosphatase